MDKLDELWVDINTIEWREANHVFSSKMPPKYKTAILAHYLSLIPKRKKESPTNEMNEATEYDYEVMGWNDAISEMEQNIKGSDVNS